MHVSLFGFAVIAAVLAFAVLTGYLTTWRRFFGKRLITCPENLEPAAVDLNAGHAATSALIHGTPSLRLTTCSRWPERRDCGQECLAQIESSPDGCLVRTIVAAWYAGKRCAVCGQSVGPVVWHERPPALLAADGTSREWKEVAPQELPKLFRDHQPLCWPCHLTLSFRHDHPDLVIERPRPVPPTQVVHPTSGVY